MTLHPLELDQPPRAIDVDQGLPEVAVSNRLFLGVLPAPGQPAFPPRIPEAIHHIRRVGTNRNWQTGFDMGAKRLKHGLKFHALVGGRRRPTRATFAVDLRPGPSTRAGIARTSPVRVDHQIRVAQFKSQSLRPALWFVEPHANLTDQTPTLVPISLQLKRGQHSEHFCDRIVV